MVTRGPGDLGLAPWLCPKPTVFIIASKISLYPKEHYENGLKRNYGASATLSMRPSEYFQRQCYVAADADESFLTHVIDVLGDERIVFSTDYPHPDSKFPHAVASFLALDRVSDASKGRILWDNALDLYGVTDVA